MKVFAILFAICITAAAEAATLNEAILQLQPTAVHDVDFRVRDDADGQGPRIVHWNATKLGAIPNPAQIDQAKAEVDAAKAAAATQREQERTVLQAVSVKLANNQDLTAGEMRAVLRALIRQQQQQQQQAAQAAAAAPAR